MNYEEVFKDLSNYVNDRSIRRQFLAGDGKTPRMWFRFENHETAAISGLKYVFWVSSANEITCMNIN